MRRYPLLAILVALGCSDGPETPPVPAPQMVTIRGTLVLPAVHLRNIAPQLSRPYRSHCNHTMPGACEAYAGTGEEDPTEDESCGVSLDPMGQEAWRLGRLAHVRATALPPRPDAAGEEVPKYTLEDGTELDLTDLVFDGEVADDGSFVVEVPASPFGYVVIVGAGKISFRHRVGDAGVAGTTLTLGRMDTDRALLDHAIRELRLRGDRRPVRELKDALFGVLGPAAERMKEAMAARMTRLDWRREARVLIRAAGLESGQGLTYEQGDSPFLNIQSGDEITDNVGSATTVRFVRSREGSPVRFQYGNQGVLVAGAGRVTEGRTGEGLGFLLVRSGNNQVDLVFRSGDIRSVGLEIQNGDSHEDTGSNPRRPFRMIAMDGDGEELYQYRYYTYQGENGPQFYGLVSPTPMGRLRIEMSSAGQFCEDAADCPFTLANVTHSAEYAELPNLGWRSDGLWQRKTDGGSPSVDGVTFDHLDRGATGPIQERGDCDWSANYSGGTYWEAGFGSHPEDGSSLWSPAYNLTNLPLDGDDTVTFDHWLSGTYEGYEESNIYNAGRCNESEATVHALNRISDPGWTDVEVEGERPGVETMRAHWSHLHWQHHVEIEDDDAVVEGTSTGFGSETARYIEYSTDNGASWRQTWWYPDHNHRGENGSWTNGHMHPFSDSDIQRHIEAGEDRDECENTDFDKDGVSEYNFNINGEDGGAEEGDKDDCRDWDTEFYYELPDPFFGEIATDPRGNAVVESFVEGISLMYRFRLVTGSAPRNCYGDCTGWRIDDVAINNDDEDVGYSTNFDQSFDPNQ